MSDELKSEILARLEGMNHHLNEISCRINKIEECINGNGSKGIKDRLTRIETWGTAISFVFGVCLSVLGIFKK